MKRMAVIVVVLIVGVLLLNCGLLDTLVDLAVATPIPGERDQTNNTSESIDAVNRYGYDCLMKGSCPTATPAP